MINRLGAGERKVSVEQVMTGGTSSDSQRFTCLQEVGSAPSGRYGHFCGRVAEPNNCLNVLRPGPGSRLRVPHVVVLDDLVQEGGRQTALRGNQEHGLQGLTRDQPVLGVVMLG